MTFMEAKGDGIVVNNLVTLKPQIFRWSEVAERLVCHGYRAWFNESEGIVTNIIVRCDLDSWRLWATTPHLYRQNYAAKIFGVPDEIMEHMPSSETSPGIGYTKSELSPPNSGQCTADWLAKVCKTPLPAFMDTERFIPEEEEQALTSQEIADFLIEQGYCRVSASTKGIARIDSIDWRSRLPANIRKGTPKGTAEDHYRRVYSRDKIRNVPLDVWKLLPSSSHNPTGYLKKYD